VKSRKWEEILLPSAGRDLWELFHENSKTSRYEALPPDEEVLATMQLTWQALPFTGYPAVELPAKLPSLNLTLSEAITTRTTARQLQSGKIALAEVAALLFYAYGITRENVGTEFPRPFRVVPSGGALYPLELFFYSKMVTGLEAGLYHYNPLEKVLRRVRAGEQTELIESILVQRELATCASLLVFITAVFERSTFKYGNRGYRFALLEAGHVAQNVNLVANALGLGCANLGGYFDRRADDFLDLDGLLHSTIYMVVIGHRAASAAEDQRQP
jgi:SagB-type dehydrogenase family enzyme